MTTVTLYRGLPGSGNFQNTHNIPQFKLDSMKDRWEELPIHLQKLCIN